jgi:hypothetical protein
MVHQQSVRVFLRGGLGNQLFQYAAGFALSERTGAELVIDSSLLPIVSHEKNGVLHRPEEISSFRHKGTIARDEETSVTRNQNFARLLQLERMVGDTFGSTALRILGSVASENRDLRGYFSKLKIPARINSYCAHPDFFASRADELRTQIYSLSQPSEFYLTHESRVENEQPIGLHFRLGDYQKLENIYGRLTSNYFEKALLETSHKDEKQNLWVFSDEPDKAKEILGIKFQNSYYVPSNASSRPLESLILLSKMKRKVLSNSTFSWWAAYLGHPKQVKTIFPRPMFARGGPKEAEGYLIEGWHQVDR